MNFNEHEEKILQFWKENKIFEKSLKNPPAGGPKGNFVFYEGPPTANGRPGIHHVEARAFKDLIPRYKTMRGFKVERKAGWDTHGLPVELEVEKELKLKSKKDIEEYGIAEFNEKCKESVWRYKEEWEKMTERIGFWIDMENPYITYENNYIESLWWIIKQAYNKGLMYKGHKVVPQCPRCGTALSSHEVAQGYENIKEESVYIKFPIRKNEYILAWTTTPWTLPGNVALAVGENMDYVKIKQGADFYYLAKGLLNKIDGEYEITEEMKGKALVGLEYEPLFSGVVKQGDKNFENAFKIYPADFVSTEDGTGVVHTAVMYGPEDYELGEKVGLPKIHTVTLDGKFNELVPKWRDKFVKDVEKEITEDLKNRGLLYKTEFYSHDYPFCWRCHTPLIYYAKDSWFFKMSELKDDLIKNNSQINWVPEHIKEGRFGEWLCEIKDWAVSRERYWGTPIPIWQCEKCGNLEVVGSLADLKEKSLESGNRYFVIRHGEAGHIVENIVNCGVSDSGRYPLTKKGEKDVIKNAEVLKNKSIDLIFSSDFCRTKQTAELAAEKLGIKKENIIFDGRLREFNVGVFDKTDAGKYQEWAPSYEERFSKTPEGGENLNGLKRRMGEFLEETDKKYSDKNILIVSHEYPIWMMFAAAAGLDEKGAIKLKTEEDFIEPACIMPLNYVFLPHDKNYELDFHRPFIDGIKLKCTKCGGEAGRTPEVMDCWFDSGAMPFAQFHYPFEKKNLIDEGIFYPADFICEAIDQTRGWFYTMLAVATLLGKGTPYKNVMSLGHVLDKKGQKMSKHLGNVVDPMEAINKYGADAVRWYMFTVNQLGEPIRFDENGLKEAGRMFTTLINILAFYKMFVCEEIEDLEENDLINVLDKWINSKLNLLIQDVTDGLDKYNVTSAARKIDAFINDLSVWYVRRSRERFRNGDRPAFKTLRHVLFNLARLMAPFAPFMAEHIYREIMKQETKREESVHLKNWPDATGKIIDRKILDDMDGVREIVSSALELRAKAGIRVRQPLQKLKIKNAKLREEFLDLIKDEVNVKEIVFDEKIINEIELDTVITDELKEEGIIRDLIRQIQDLRKKLGLTPGDIMTLSVETDVKGESLVRKFEGEIKKSTRLKEIKLEKVSDGAVEVKIDDLIFRLKIRN